MLLEILVGLALFSIGIVAVLTSLRTSMGMQERSGDLWRASLVLDEVVREFRATPIEQRQLEGKTESGIEWAVEVKPWETAESFVVPEWGVAPDVVPAIDVSDSLDVVSVKVVWQERGRARSLETQELISRSPRL